MEILRKSRIAIFGETAAEKAQAVANALAAKNPAAVIEAVKRLFENYPYDPEIMKPVLDAIDVLVADGNPIAALQVANLGIGIDGIDDLGHPCNVDFAFKEKLKSKMDAIAADHKMSRDEMIISVMQGKPEWHEFVSHKLQRNPAGIIQILEHQAQLTRSDFRSVVEQKIRQIKENPASVYIAPTQAYL